MSATVTITLPDGGDVAPEGSTYLDLAASIGPRLASAVVAASCDGHQVDLDAPLATAPRWRC